MRIGEINDANRRSGRIAAIEVKATTGIGAGAFRSLGRLRDPLGKRFVRGAVRYTGPDAHPFGDRLTAQPLSVLWETWVSRFKEGWQGRRVGLSLKGAADGKTASYSGRRS